jgi:hypothetical protein
LRSFLSLYAPNLIEAITRLEALAASFSDVSGGTQLRHEKKKKGLFGRIRGGKPTIGEWDFVFEWHETPEINRIMELIEGIDEKLSGLKTKYSITTETLGSDPTASDLEANMSITYLKIYGPPIAQTITKLIKIENLSKKISSFGLCKGQFDFYFTWRNPPSNDELRGLIECIENQLNDLGSLFNVTTVDSLALEKRKIKNLDIHYHKDILDKARMTLRTQ